MLLIFGVRLSPRLVHLVGSLTGHALRDAASIVFGTLLLAILCTIISGWRTGASSARAALTEADGSGR